MHDEHTLPNPSELLELYGRRAKKRYSQNFLKDSHTLNEIADIAGVTENQEVLEIGPGPGGLTTYLLHRGANVRVIEADPTMVEHLRSVFSGAENLELIEGDVLSHSIEALVGSPPRRIAANLPYSIATEVLFRILELEDKPRRMALMFQKEVAERITAQPGDRAFGMLGLQTMFHYNTTIERTLAPSMFIPPPKVTSSVVGFRLRETPICSREKQEDIVKIGRAAFNQRRKMLRKSLRQIEPDAENRLLELGVTPTKRPEALTMSDWLALSNFSCR